MRSQTNPGMTDHTGGLIFGAERQFFFAVDDRVVLDAKDKKSFGLIDLTEKLVILAVIAIAHISLSGHAHLAQRLAFAITALGDAGVDRFVLRDVKTQMQTHPFGISLGADSIFRPAHARQRP